MPDYTDFDLLSPENKEAVRREALSIGSAPVVIMELGVTATLSLLGALQLALRHPEYQKLRTYAQVEQIARNLHDSLRPYPAIEAVAAAGWNPQFDQPTAAPNETHRSDLYLRYLGVLGLLGECSVEVEEETRATIITTLEDAIAHHPLRCKRIGNRFEIEPIPTEGKDHGSH